jgi:hypothetical protein
MNETQVNSSFVFDEAIKVEYEGNATGIHLYSGYCSKEWRIGIIQNGGTVQNFSDCDMMSLERIIFFLNFRILNFHDFKRIHAPF